MESKKRVLIVEDEPLIAADTSNKLHRLGYEVPAIASCAEEALLAASATSPDLVLMDINIDGTADGIEVARRISAELRIPIVFLTAHEDLKTLHRAQEADPFGYLTKPASSVNLANAIETALGRYRKQSAQNVREAWLEAQLMSVGEGFIAANCDGTIWFINPEGERLLGISGSDIIGKSFLDSIPLRYQSTRGLAPDLVRLAFLQGAPMNLGEEFEVDRPGGRKITGEIAISRYGGEPIGIVFTFRDNTVQSYSRTSLQNTVALGEDLDLARGPMALYEVLYKTAFKLRDHLSPSTQLNVVGSESVYLISGNQNILEIIVKELVGRAEARIEKNGAIYISASNLDFERRHTDGSIARYVRLRLAYKGHKSQQNNGSVQARIHYEGVSIDSSMARVQGALQALQATAQEGSSQGLAYWDIDFPALPFRADVQEGNSHSALLVLVEPDSAVRSALCAYLTRDHVECLGARDAQEALDWVRTFPGQIDIVILPETEYCSNVQTLLNESGTISILLVSKKDTPGMRLLEGCTSCCVTIDPLSSQEVLRDTIDRLLQTRTSKVVPTECALALRRSSNPVL